MTNITGWKSNTRRVLGMVALATAIATPAAARTETVKLTLLATGADADALGTGKVKIRNRAGALSGKFELRGRRLSGLTEYQVTIDGVRIGTMLTSPSGNGRARFRTDPSSSRDQLLGVDPRGRSVAIVDDGGAVVLTAAAGTGTLDGNDVRCCLPDDSGPECEDRTAAECAAAGGVDLGPGSCLPNPCDALTPPPAGSDIVCCLPDDSGPECEDRTPAECSALGGVNLGAGSCLPNPCAPVGPAPDDDIRCCLPDDSGPECEDRTAAECDLQGGVNIGPGACLPTNPCMSGATSTTLPGATTTTSLPGGGTPAIVVTCERRANRSRASVNGSNLASGNYTARLSSGANTAASGAAGTIGDEVEFDFDSDPADIAAGATPIGAGFLQGAPPQATGEILDSANQVVVSATVTCTEQ